jgi:hypothetical protein
MRISHQEPLAARFDCLDCHAAETHAQKADLLPRDHASCAPCHDGTTAANTCTTCHVSEPSRDRTRLPGREAVLHGPDWERLHALGEMSTCTTCHEREFCASCHTIELPHSPTSWPKLHGDEALRVGEPACLSCHEKAFCTSCHSAEMPHPGDYQAAHAKDARDTGEAKCGDCHVRETCDTCHVKHVHPGVDPERLQNLREGLG